MKKIVACLLILSFPSLFYTEFEFTFEPIDVVIPCHHKDLHTLDAAIEGAKENIKNLGRVYVISEKPLTENAEWFDEKKFPFTKESIALEIFKDEKRAYDYIHHPKSRLGWIYQQFLKLFCSFVIPHISSNVLILDSDTIFLRPIEFQDSATGAGLYCTAPEHHESYFNYGKRLIPEWKKIFPTYSGITHHMLIQKSVIHEMFKAIQKAHNTNPFSALCKSIDKTTLYHSCLSEYELYFNYVFSHSKLVKLRRLNWDNCRWSDFRWRKDRGYDYLSCHAYM